MSENGYTNIPDWMLALDIDIYETVILAVIFGFSQDGESSFAGSQNYLAWKAHCKRNKVAKSLAHLVEMGLISKTGKSVRGVKSCEYKVALKNTCCIPQIQPCISEIQPCIPQIHNNTIYNTIYNKERENKKQRPKFEKPSVDEVRQYCQARGNDIDAEEFVAFYESKGWVVGKSSMKDWKAAVITWEKSRKKSPAARPAPRRQESAFEQNLRTMDALMGTNYHERAYGQKEDRQ